MRRARRTTVQSVAMTIWQSKEMRTAVGMVDRRSWKTGPWDTEPDLVEMGTACGFLAVVLRHPESGTLNAYLAIPDDHPWWGKRYDAACFDAVNVHGGLTYSRGSLPRYAHSEQGVDSGPWWIGFDTGHSGDGSPDPRRLYHAVYRSMSYVIDELESLAEQVMLAAEKVGT